MKKNILLWTGAALLAFLLLAAAAGPYLPFIDRNLEEVRFRMENGHLIKAPYEISWRSPLGSSKFGVDNLSRIVVGARETLAIVFGVSLLRYALGVPLGLLAGRRKGFSHLLLVWLNRLFSSMPALLMTVLLAAVPFFLFSPGRLYWMIGIMALVETGRVGYIVQQHTAALSQESYMEAGRALGLRRLRMFKAYYIPALLPDLIVNFCLDLGKVLILIGQLGVLTVYLNPGSAEAGLNNEFEFVNTAHDWGSMISDQIPDLNVGRFGSILVPVFAIVYAVLAFNFLGEGLRRHFNGIGRVK
ncbi:ABC transporter permease subunit [Saccharibacillus sp. CPCC 101409]|uniref:ABC transporter permease n=1 Tax=Saccharibacillus sp. CPCC 101409 TaxID=3058041 RepID=UPI00267390B9|nr:ABC transporter permease subunit [Saccharibacillus sp. CPCC 101409]MDO3408721.1 ABC transporter permease subunit [Saccharibacillus sp. CPCC 101409]